MSFEQLVAFLVVPTGGLMIGLVMLYVTRKDRASRSIRHP
jgi:hypothetical protein